MNQTAITIYDRLAEQNAMQAVEMMGNAIARCGMFGVTKPEQGVVLALTSLMERRSVTELARQFHIIEGKLTMRADAMQAAFQASGGRITWKTTTEKECEAVFSHVDYCPDGVTVRITLDELKASGVAIGRGGELKTNYQKFPRQMLRARVISEGVRMVDPSVIVGVYTPEEVSDFGEQRPVRPIQDAEYEPEPKARKTADNAVNSRTFDELIPEDRREAAVGYLMDIGWLAAGEGLDALKPGHLSQIQQRPERFMAAVDNWEAQSNE